MVLQCAIPSDGEGKRLTGSEVNITEIDEYDRLE